MEGGVGLTSVMMTAMQVSLSHVCAYDRVNVSVCLGERGREREKERERERERGGGEREREKEIDKG